MRNINLFVRADDLLIEAARASQRAAKACRTWECGGAPDAVGDTSDAARVAIDRVIALAQEEGDAICVGEVPGTRRARLALAGYMLLLAGTDEHGESADLVTAASIFRRAAIA